MTTLLVTGGLGFIGSGFILYMLSRYPDCRIVNLDAMTYAGRRENAAEAERSPRYRFVRGDIADEETAERILRGEAGGPIDAVVHFAAESHVDRSIASPLDFTATNAVGTHRLLEAARRCGVKRFVHVSTDEVYGSLGAEGYFTESSPLAPNSPYSASKAASDLMARAYFHTFGLPVVITRCSNNYGPRQHPEKLVPLTILRALHDRTIPVYGTGANVRDWLYVEDHCAAVDAALRRGVPGEVYNIGGHNEKTNLELVRTILRLLGKPESLIRFVADRPGHDARYAIDPAKTAAELGWSPSRTFEQGIRETVDWYVRNPAWWRPLVDAAEAPKGSAERPE